MRKTFLFVLALAGLLAAIPAHAARWTTTCTVELQTIGFCAEDQLGQPLVIIGWGLTPEDAARIAAAECGLRNFQADNPEGLTCAAFAERELRAERLERVRQWELQERLRLEKEAAEGEIVPPKADGHAAVIAAPDGDRLSLGTTPSSEGKTATKGRHR